MAGGLSHPRAIGDYELLGPLASGGQGVVYEARRAGSDERVALKVLLTTDPGQLPRFRQEAQVLARLEHPHIVRVLDQGVERGRPYLVMERLAGLDLDAQVRAGGPLDADRIVEVLAPIADALEACHAAGIVHRDLKPGNVVVDGADRPVLIDFGLLKRDPAAFGALSQDARITALTESGELLGTPAFMSPEQIDPSFGAVGPRSDVYALGATLYVLLTGSPPFRGGSALATCEQVLRVDPADPRRSRPEAPPGLVALCLRALAKRPEDRPASAAAFGRALREVAQAPAVGRRRWPAAAGGLGLLALIGLGWGLTRPEVEEAPAASWKAEAARRSAAADEAGAARVIHTAALEGDVEAMLALANRYEHGIGLIADEVAARGWLQLASPSSPEAAFHLGRLLEAAAPGPNDGPGARRCYADAAARGCVPAMVTLGQRVRFEPGGEQIAQTWWRRAAAEGSTEAMLLLGELRRHGYQLPRDPRLAVRWFRQAAEAGDPNGMIALAMVRAMGDGVAKDAAAARGWLRRAALGGSGRAARLLAQRLPDDPVAAVRWLRVAARLREREAMFALGRRYAEGRGVARDPERAHRWLLEAWYRGVRDAAQALIRFHRPLSAGEPDVGWWVAWLLVARKTHPAESECGLGDAYLGGLGVPHDIGRAARHYRRAVERKSAKATLQLAMLHLRGWGVPKDAVRARRLLALATQRGSADAWVYGATLIHDGIGGKRDPVEALSWLRKGVEAGSPAGWEKLGLAYRDGSWGLERDEAEARRLLRQAAQAGLPEAMIALGELLASGRGGSRDVVDAARWYRRATPKTAGEQRAQVEQRLRDLQARYPDLR